MVRFQSLEGAASYTHDKFFTLGFNYTHPLNNILDIESGLEYSKHTLYIHPNLPPYMDVAARLTTISLVSIPITVKVNLLRHIYFNGGVMLDVDLNGSGGEYML